MTRILYLIDNLSVGGTERQLCLLLKYLSTNWESRVVSLGDGPFHQVMVEQGTSVVVYQRRNRFDPIPVFQLFSEIVHYKPDIIHSWGWMCSTFVAPICKILSIPLVNGSIRKAGRLTRHKLRTRITFALSDCIVANSYTGLSDFMIPSEKGRVVFNAIDPDRLKLIRQKSNLQKDFISVVMTGRITPLKDFYSFFEAARRINLLEPGNWKFIAIGAGKKEDRKEFIILGEDLVEAGIADLPLAGLEVLSYINNADVGVLLSASCHKEGISNSIMEYMACRLPVICTDSGGNRELVIDGETGFIIPSENVDLLIEKLLIFKKHPEISNRMGNSGYKRIMSLCSIERMISDYEFIYANLMGKRHKRT